MASVPNGGSCEETAYGLNDLFDSERAVTVDVEAAPVRTYDEVASTEVVTERAGRRFGLKPGRLAADGAYGTGKFLARLVGRDITPMLRRAA